MIIDCHCHLNPIEWSENRPRAMFDLETMVATQDEAGVDVSIVSNPMIGRLPKLDLRELDKLKFFHEFAADIMSRYPGRIYCLADAVPYRGEEYLKETERAIRELGMVGVMVNSSVDGEYLDSPRAFPFYEMMCDLDVPVFVHPPGVTPGAEYMENFRLVEMIGRPMDTTLSMARVLYSGVLERFPNLKFVCSHLGGAITMLQGRMDYGYECREHPGFGEWGPISALHPPGYYLQKLYLDTMNLHLPALKCGLETVGADHILLGTDYPPVQVPLRKHLDLIRQMTDNAEEQQKILGDNARKLLKI